MSDALPKGWINCTLGDVIKIQNGYAFPSKDFQASGIPVIRQSNLAGDRVSLEKCVCLPECWLEKKADFVLHKNDVLIGMSGSVGKLCIYDLDRPALQNQRTGKVVLRSTEIVEWRFIWEFLKTVERQLLEKGKGMGVLNVSADDIESLPLNLAPLAEQKRIVAKLEKVLEKVDASRARLDKIPALLKRFRQSVLAAACSGRLTADWREENPDENADSLAATLSGQRMDFWERREVARMKATGKFLDDDKWKRRYKPPFAPSDDFQIDLPTTWSIATVSQIAFLDVGFAFKSSEFSDEGIRLLRGENLEPGKLRWNDTQCWPSEKLNGLEHLLIEEGEIILALDRPVISTGLKIARAEKSDLPCLLVQRMMRFKMANPRMTDWLFFNLNLPAFIRHLSAGLTGSDLPHVTGTGVAEYTFGLPPLAEQQEIVKRVEELFALADQLEARYSKAKAQIDRLTQSILAKAFRGELVPQNPNDEPAEKLLARIKSERDKSAPKKKPRK